MIEGLVLLIVGILAALVLRRFRISPYGLVETNRVEHLFRSTLNSELSFSGDTARVLHSDVRFDLHAKGPPTEAIVPFRAVKICQNNTGEFFLWSYQHPADSYPNVIRLSEAEATRMLLNKPEVITNAFPNSR